MHLTDEQIIAIRDEHLPSQGEAFDTLAFARAIEAAVLAANPGVPREPTEEMLEEVRDTDNPSGSDKWHTDIWRAMYDAATDQPAVADAATSNGAGKSGIACTSAAADPSLPAVAGVLRRLDDDARIFGDCHVGDVLRAAAAMIRSQEERIASEYSLAHQRLQRAERAETLCKLEMETRERVEAERDVARKAILRMVAYLRLNGDRSEDELSIVLNEAWRGGGLTVADTDGAAIAAGKGERG